MPAPALTDLALGLSRRPVAGLDPLGYLGAAAAEITRALDVSGAVLVVSGPGWVRGSDDDATLVGEIQRRDDHGPLPTAVRTTRPMLTPDLTRIGPPALAALAGELGFTSAAAVPLIVDGHVVAALHLIGRAGRPVETGHVDALGPILAVLGARIVDLVEIARLRRSATPPVPAARTESVQPRHGAPPELVTEELSTVRTNVLPLPRREHTPRHRSEG